MTTHDEGPRMANGRAIIRDANGFGVPGPIPFNPCPPVDTASGAPFGRYTHPGTLGGMAEGATILACRVHLSEGYDNGGAYWGERTIGTALYAIGDPEDGEVIGFFDATSRANLESQVRAFVPGAVIEWREAV